jgi:hypothetical protein
MEAAVKPFGKFVKRLTVLRPTSGGGVEQTLDDRYSKKRKVSPGLRRFEKRKRRMLEAKAEFANQMLSRHEQSNAERKDGFLRDSKYNRAKARRKAWKRFTRV